MGDACSGVQFDIGIAQDLVPLLLASTQQGLDTRHQLLGSERFHQIIVGSRLESFHPVSDGITRREHQDRNVVACLSQSLRHFQSVQPRHHDIEYDEIGWTLQRTIEGLAAASRDGDAIPFIGKDAP